MVDILYDSIVSTRASLFKGHSMQARQRDSRDRQQQIVRLLEAAERALSCSVCIHDFFQQMTLPGHWQRHHGKGCAAYRLPNLPECKAFDGQRIHQELAQSMEGQTHVCPFGLREVAVPILAGGRYAGVLFAGDFPSERHGDGADQDGHRLVLLCIAQNIGRMLSGQDQTPVPDSRGRIIMAWIEEHMDATPMLKDLARRLCLSPSRAARVVRDHFNMSLTELVQTTKLNNAAYWLTVDNMPVGEIASMLGYCNQAYFTRLFTRRFGQCPTRYRHAAQAKGIGS